MAEFCKDCFRALFKVDIEEEKLIMSKEKELCEGCGSYKEVVIALAEKKKTLKILPREKKGSG